MGWVFETSLAAPSSHSDIWVDFELDWVELGTYLVDLSSHSDICIDLEWVFETYLAPSSLSDIMLLNVDWIGLGPSLETSLVAPNSHSDIIYVAPWSYI